MKWHAKQWSDLTRDELHAMVRLRIDVFVVEQDCPYSDLDGKDLRAWHVWAEDEKESKGGGSGVCTGPGPRRELRQTASRRVATRRDCRGSGLGKALMEKSIAVCEEVWPGHDIRISAQCYLEAWYEGLGFKPVGEPYLEDGIPHLQMVRSGGARDLVAGGLGRHMVLVVLNRCFHERDKQRMRIQHSRGVFWMELRRHEVGVRWDLTISTVSCQG